MLYLTSMDDVRFSSITKLYNTANCNQK